MILERGFYWSATNQTPTKYDNIITVTGSTESFWQAINRLLGNTTYYYRAYATNSEGTTSGAVLSFTTQDIQDNEINTFTDPRDGKIYKTVKIGNQLWMAENLAYLPMVHRPLHLLNYDDPRYYVFGYDGIRVSEAKATANYKEYGVLYNWPAANSACPSGWHLPSDDEWKQMEIAIGMSQSEADHTGHRGTNEGTKLITTSGWNYNGNGTDDFGFSALPGGYRKSGGHFWGIGGSTYWWSSTEATEVHTTDAWGRHIYYNSTAIIRFNYPKDYGFSVRCVKD